MPIHKFGNDLGKIMILVVFICLILCTIRIYLKKKKLNWPNYNKKQPCFSAAPLNCPNLWFVRRYFFPSTMYCNVATVKISNLRWRKGRRPSSEREKDALQWMSVLHFTAMHCNSLHFTAMHCSAMDGCKKSWLQHPTLLKKVAKVQGQAIACLHNLELVIACRQNLELVKACHNFELAIACHQNLELVSPPLIRGRTLLQNLISFPPTLEDQTWGTWDNLRCLCSLLHLLVCLPSYKYNRNALVTNGNHSWFDWL